METQKLNLISTQCCVCENNNATFLGKGEDFEYRTSPDTFLVMQCNSCSLVYLNPRPGTSDFKQIYPSTYHAFNFSKKDYGVVYKIRSRLEASRLLNRCSDLQENARILDVGCGDGFHLRLLRDFGKKSWVLEGVDIDKHAIDMATRAGLTVHLGTVEEIDLQTASYDLIFMIQTIEHVEHPDKVLLATYNLLREGGRMVIVTDNTDSFDFKLFKGKYWGGYHFPRHLNLFNRYSLSRLAEKTGFEIEKLTTIVSPVNWIYSIHNALVDWKKPYWLINCFTLKSPFSLGIFTAIDFVLQKFGKGALLQITLRKPR